jgi:S-(hydroxymethyl)glutathione dehydrogenase/alcohol dehydrogenase
VSVSAFAPICHPTACPWGQKAFANYLGSVEAGSGHDATLLLAKMGRSVYDDIMIDEGTSDEFVAAGQLLLSDFEKAAAAVGQKLLVRRLEGFDHSYHFMAAFIGEHVAYHAAKLRVAAGRVAARNALKAKAEALALAKDDPSSPTAGKPIRCRAMVARAPKQPLVLEEITVDPPRAGEVRVRVVANALCHTVRHKKSIPFATQLKGLGLVDSALFLFSHVDALLPPRMCTRSTASTRKACSRRFSATRPGASSRASGRG